MRRSWLGTVVWLALLATGCHDLEALADGSSGNGGNGGNGGTGGSSGSSGDGGSGGSGGSGGNGGGGNGGSGGSGGNGDLFCSSVNCTNLDNPFGGELCCTAPGSGDPTNIPLSLTGRGPDLCGMRLDTVDPSFDDRCWQLAQPGVFDSNCGSYNDPTYGTLPGCCTDEGYCALQHDALGLGCTYAWDGVVGLPCGDNPIDGCHPTKGPFCNLGSVCRPVYISDRQIGTYACVDPATIPEYGLDADCSEGWYDANANGVTVSADPCAEGLVCVLDPKQSSGWTCQPYCDENQPCAGTERCYPYSDPHDRGLSYPACKPTESCGLGSGTVNCALVAGQSCYLSYDWYAMHAHDECLVDSPSAGTAVGDVCTDLAGCPPWAVCIGPLGVNPDDWGDGDPANDFRCTAVCGAVGAPGCPNCTSLDSWGMYPYDDMLSPPSLCPLSPVGSGGSGGGGGGSGGAGG